MRRLLLLLALSFAACTGDDVDVCAGAPTYESDIRAILDDKCIDCHHTTVRGLNRNGAPEGIDFDDYATLADHVTAIADAITSGREPPRGTPDAPPGTTAAERDLVTDWRRCGFPED